MRWLGVIAAIIAATVDTLYLGIVDSQGGGDPQFLRVPFVAAFIALMAICAALSSWASAARWRALLLAISAAGLLLLGFFAIFSIGFPLLVAGALASVELIRTLRPSDPSRGTLGKAAVAWIAVGGAAMAVMLLLAGLTVTELAIRCPVSGTMGGTGVTFLAGSYQYTCSNGALTITP